MKIKNQNRIKKKKSPLKSFSQLKSKQKTKQKTKKFNPLQYLNALIQLTNDTNALKLKKNKLPQKRDLSSALTIATPAMQKTISTSKLRCKSSYSQYRKKSTTSNVNNLKQVLNLKLDNYIITEEEDSSHCIKFTSMQSANNSKQQTPLAQKTQKNPFDLKNYHHNFKNPKLSHFINTSHQIDYNYYARKIQRAWKSFQTYKMIHKYYRHFKKQKKQEKQQMQQQRKLQYAPRSNHQSFLHQNDQDQAPSVFAYLNGYYNGSIQSNDNGLSNAHEQPLQKTVKFKIRNSQPPVNNKQGTQLYERGLVLEGQNSSSENQLNLTQKLDQIKAYIQNQSLRQTINDPLMEQIPTVEIKKSIRQQSKQPPQQPDSIQRSGICLQQDENQSTQKKRFNLPLSMKIINKSGQQLAEQQLGQFQLEKSLDRSPTVKEEFSSSFKKQTQNKKQASGRKQVSLVDSMIRKQTQKYNQILSLIEGPKKKSDASYILTELLSRLEKHKQQLQGDKMHNKTNFQAQFTSSNKQPSCENSSFLAFQSKDLYHSFEDYQFNSQEKPKTKILTSTNNTQLQIKHSDSKTQTQNSGKNLEQNLRGQVSMKPDQNPINYTELLKSFSTLLAQEGNKLSQFIKDVNQQRQIKMEIDFSQASSQQSQFYLSEQLCNEIELENPSDQTKQVIQGHFQQSETSSMYSLCSSQCQSDAANKMFDQHLSLISFKKDLSTKNLTRLVQEKRIPKQSFQARLEQVEQKFAFQRKSIELKRQKYLKSLHSVKRQALQFQRDLLSSAKKAKLQNESNSHIWNQNRIHSSLAVRKSFSAESIVLKCILGQPALITKDIEVNAFQVRGKERQTHSQEGKNQGQEKKISKLDLSERGDIEGKIGHNQNITQLSTDSIRDLQENVEKQNPLTSQQKEENYNNYSTKMVDIQSQQCERSKQLRKVSQYTEQVWVKIDETQRLSDQCWKSLQVFGQHQESHNQSRKQQAQDQTQLQAVKSENSDQLLIEEAVRQRSQRQEQQVKSPVSSQDSPYAQVSPALMQRCSEQLQKLIENQLINELLQTIYMNESILKLFKPFIQQIFEFKQITDQSIVAFVESELPQYFPPFPELIQRANQKINPTSLQILRLVRDFEYEIDGYELILSEQVFEKTRKFIELQYQQKIKLNKKIEAKPSLTMRNLHLIEKVYQRETQKRQKFDKYLIYERDMKILYMRAIFNCLNNFLIEQKASATHVNTRSTIGEGELSLSIKQFNSVCAQKEVHQFIRNSQERIKDLLKNKCMLPSFKNYKDVGLFQKQMLKLIKNELDETEYKWVTYIDEVLQIWNEIASQVIDKMMIEATHEALMIKSKQSSL